MKEKLAKLKSNLVKAYIIVITLLCIYWSPFITFADDMLMIDFPFYSKTILVAE